MVSRVEFEQMCADERCRTAFEELNVDMDNFEKMTGFLFDPDEPDDPDKELSFGDMMKRVLTMRGTNTARVFDIMELNKHITRQNQILLDKLNNPRRGATVDLTSPVGASAITARVEQMEDRFDNRLDSIEKAVKVLATQVGTLAEHV